MSPMGFKSVNGEFPHSNSLYLATTSKTKEGTLTSNPNALCFLVVADYR